MHAALDCGFYFKRWAHLDGDPLLIPYGYDVNLQDIQINTKQRALAYMIYNRKLGGGVYSSPDGSYKRFCDFDVDKLLGE
jgi:hypothetical protein